MIPNLPFLEMIAYHKTNDVHTRNPKMTFWDQNTTSSWGLRRKVQDVSNRDEGESVVRRFISGRTAVRDQQFSRISKVPKARTRARARIFAETDPPVCNY